MPPAPLNQQTAAALAPRVYTAESLATRQRAVSQLTEYLTGLGEELRAAADSLIGGSEDKPIQQFMDQAKALRALINRCIAEQGRILNLYAGIDELSKLTEWNYLSQRMQPAFDEYMQIVQIILRAGNKPNLTAGEASNTAARLRFAESVGGWRAWLAQTRASLGSLRAQYDNAEVHKQ